MNGEALKMVMQLNTRTPRAVVGLGLCALLAACGTGRDTGTRVIAPDPVVAEDRFGSGDSAADYTAVVPGARPSLQASDIEANAPNHYTVVKGDTLWGISGRFLKQPWMWTEIWGYNPQIANPHLIYPGDQIALEYVNGEPVLVLTRNGVRLPHNAAINQKATINGQQARAYSGDTVRLSPRIRPESLSAAVPTIPADAIEQFLLHPRVITSREIAQAPYVVGNHDRRVISSLGQEIYARGDISHKTTRYGIYRKSKALRDPETRDLLGYEVMHVGEAKLLNIGDPATMVITRNKMETLSGDILLPVGNEGFLPSYTPRLPGLRGEGRIVSLVNAISQSGRDQIVVLNLGADAGIQVGDVLAIESRGKMLSDRHSARLFDRVREPNERTGVVMVFQTFDRVSYALVMESTRPVTVNDIVAGI